MSTPPRLGEVRLPECRIGKTSTPAESSTSHDWRYVALPDTACPINDSFGCPVNVFVFDFCRNRPWSGKRGYRPTFPLRPLDPRGPTFPLRVTFVPTRFRSRRCSSSPSTSSGPPDDCDAFKKTSLMVNHDRLRALSSVLRQSHQITTNDGTDARATMAWNGI